LAQFFSETFALARLNARPVYKDTEESAAELRRYFVCLYSPLPFRKPLETFAPPNKTFTHNRNSSGDQAINYLSKHFKITFSG